MTFYDKFLISILSIIKDKEKCDTAGWGLIKIHKNQSIYAGELQEALVPIVELERCTKMWEDSWEGPPITNKTICAGGLRDACVVRMYKVITPKYFKH